jgi:hypothetical protein
MGTIVKEKFAVNINEYLVCTTRKIEGFSLNEKYQVVEFTEDNITFYNNDGNKVSFNYEFVKRLFRKLDYIHYYESQQNKDLLKEGDMVLLKPAFFNSFLNHCDDETVIPLHNHGKVLSVTKDHKWKYTAGYSMYYLVEIELPNKEVIELFSSDLIKLY